MARKRFLSPIAAGLLCFLLAAGLAGPRPGRGGDLPLEAVPTDTASAEKEGLSRRQKSLLLNGGGVGLIVLYGFTAWDYGEHDFHFKNEGWFGRDTKDGGMDKLGHFWASYALTHLLAETYESWGYAEEKSLLYGTGSTLLLQTAMEVADGFSGFGFSWEDFLANLLGTAVGYHWKRHPALQEKIDFRLEYMPSFDGSDFDPFTNYKAHKYLMAVKADGFPALRRPGLEYLELHLGYYARGYDSEDVSKRNRHPFIGLGLNVGKLARRHFDTRIFDYLQLPYISLSLSADLD